MTDTDSWNHTGLMDATYRWQRYVYDFTRKYYLLGRDQLIADMDAAPGSAVVEVGCGTARNLIKMARLYPGATFYGLDASEEMLKTARRSIERAGLTDRIYLAQGLAENLSPAVFGLPSLFDHAVFSYSLSMIPDWKQALISASRAVGTGKIHIVDFGGMEGWGPLASLLELWLRFFNVTPRKEILQQLESGHHSGEQRTHLRILPTHYAFIWQGGGKAVQNLAL